MEYISSDEFKDKADEIARKSGLEDILGGRGGKLVKSNYRELWDKMVREAASCNLLDDGYFLDKVINLGIALSTSVVREFRKVATMTVSQISISLLVIVSNLNEIREASANQASMEKSKKSKQSSRSLAFEEQMAKAAETIKELLSYVDSIFQSVFTTRFRDVDSEIRAFIIDGIGRWMNLYPSTFLSATYLKYLAWALSDKDAPVRLAAVNSVLAIYNDKGNAIQLKDFTNRFSDRMKELMEDKDDAVAVAGTELVTLLVKQGHLSSDIGQHVFNLLSDSSFRIRSAAAELAAGMITEVGKQQIHRSKEFKNIFKKSKSSKGTKKSGPTSSDFELAGVLSVLHSLSNQQYGHEETVSMPLQEKIVYFVVSSLSHKLPSLSNWNLMVEWLKGDIASNLIGEVATKNLANCLLCAMKSATSRALKGGLVKEKKASVDKARQDLTLLLQKELPELLVKYQSEPDILATIVRYVQYMKLELYSLKRQEANLGRLLNLVKDMLFQHSEPECSLACASSIAWCTREGKNNTRDIAKSVYSQCVDECTQKLTDAVGLLSELGPEGLGEASRSFRDSNYEEETESLFKIRSAINRFAAIQEAIPSPMFEHKDAETAMRTVLRFSSEGWDLPSAIVFDAERYICISLIATLSKMMDNSTEEEVSLLAEARSDLTTRINAIIGTAILEERFDVAAKVILNFYRKMLACS